LRQEACASFSLAGSGSERTKLGLPALEEALGLEISRCRGIGRAGEFDVVAIDLAVGQRQCRLGGDDADPESAPELESLCGGRLYVESWHGVQVIGADLFPVVKIETHRHFFCEGHPHRNRAGLNAPEYRTRDDEGQCHVARAFLSIIVVEAVFRGLA
jgi:hypothetical protein